MVGFILIREPKLAFVLPFKVSRLTIIKTDSGIPIFSYKWNRQEDLIDDTLFSGMLQGISLFVKESLQRGNLQEIKLDNGYLMIERDTTRNVAVILISTHPTRTLRNTLKYFTNQFIAKYEDELENVADVAKFTENSKLVESIFSFIPE